MVVYTHIDSEAHNSTLPTDSSSSSGSGSGSSVGIYNHSYIRNF